MIIHLAIYKKFQCSQGLHQVFSDPMIELYLLFYQAVLQPFVIMNKFMQREDTIISVMHMQLTKIDGKIHVYSCYSICCRDN